MATQEITVKQKKEVEKGAGESTRPGPVFVPAVEVMSRSLWKLALGCYPSSFY